MYGNMPGIFVFSSLSTLSSSVFRNYLLTGRMIGCLLLVWLPVVSGSWFCGVTFDCYFSLHQLISCSDLFVFRGSFYALSIAACNDLWLKEHCWNAFFVFCIGDFWCGFLFSTWRFWFPFASLTILLWFKHVLSLMFVHWSWFWLPFSWCRLLVGWFHVVLQSKFLFFLNDYIILRFWFYMPPYGVSVVVSLY